MSPENTAPSADLESAARRWQGLNRSTRFRIRRSDYRRANDQDRRAPGRGIRAVAYSSHALNQNCRCNETPMIRGRKVVSRGVSVTGSRSV
jgi:hypothetical protein